MGFWSLLEVASMPIIQVLLVGGLGAFMATGYCNLLPSDARKSINNIVFVVFTPCLVFSSLVKTVTLEDIISWWFMPLNVGLTFVFGGILGWVAVKLLKPDKYLEGLIIAVCSSGNLGNLMVIIIPAICNEDGSPFGDHDICRSNGLSYASFSMALGGFFLWTYTYQLIRSTATGYKALKDQEAMERAVKKPNLDFDADEKASLLNEDTSDFVSVSLPPSEASEIDTEALSAGFPGIVMHHRESIWGKAFGVLHQIVEELLSPPTLGAFFGFFFGSISWLKGLIIGEGAPLHVFQDCIQLLGNGTIPCITLILGGNLTQGLKSGKVKPRVIIGVLLVKYLLLPVIGAGTVKLAANLGFLPQDPLFQFALMIQYTLPPAMSIGTMAQLFDVGQDECSVLYLWTYLVAGFALTFWATTFMWILS